MPPNYDIEEEDLTFWERYRVFIAIGVLLFIVAGISLAAFLLAGKPSKAKPPEEIAIHLLPPPPAPPPPPPPPPPKVPPPPEQKMVQQPPVKPDEVKPKNEPKSPDKPPGPPGPPASGAPSEFGIGGGGGNGGGSGGEGGGSKFGYYANEVVASITDAIRRNNQTRDASAHVKVRLWVDGTGRVTRAKLASSSDDPAIDAAIQNQVLTGLTLPEAPPADMPMPIVLLLSEVRPN